MPGPYKYPIPSGTRRTGSIKRAFNSLERCGCLNIWEEFTDLAIECRMCDLAYGRIKWCISEQCWGPLDVEERSLNEADRAVPYPDKAHRILSQKAKTCKSLSREVRQAANRKRLALVTRHRTCPLQRGRVPNAVFKFTKDLVETAEVMKKSEIAMEMEALIS